MKNLFKKLWDSLLKKTQDWFNNKTGNKDNIPVPNPIPTPEPEPVNPEILVDDKNVYITAREAGRVVKNDGQFTYLNKVLTTKPHGQWYPICVQYNNKNLSDMGVFGEVTVWKDFNNKSVKVDNLPKDIVIDKIVIWYELGK